MSGIYKVFSLNREKNEVKQFLESTEIRFKTRLYKIPVIRQTKPNVNAPYHTTSGSGKWFAAQNKLPIQVGTTA